MLELVNVKKDGTRTIVGKMSDDGLLMIDGLNNALKIRNVGPVYLKSDLETVLGDESTQVYRATEDDDSKMEFFIKVSGYQPATATISVHHPVFGCLISQEFNALDQH